jgi:hypothetical protein
VRIAVAEARGQFGNPEKGERLPVPEIASHFLTTNIVYKYDNFYENSVGKRYFALYNS